MGLVIWLSVLARSLFLGQARCSSSEERASQTLKEHPEDYRAMRPKFTLVVYSGLKWSTTEAEITPPPSECGVIHRG